MAADITDMFRKLAYRGTQTTLSGNGYNPGDTSATLANSANWQTETAICFSMLRKDSNGNEVTGSYTVWGAVLIGDTLTNLQLLFGSDQAYAPGGNTVVVMYVTAAQMNLLIDGILVSHTQTGELKNKIVTLAKLNGGSTQGLLKVGEDGVVSVGKAESDNINFAMSIQAYTNTGFGGGTVKYVNIGGIKVAWFVTGIATYPRGGTSIVNLPPGFFTAINEVHLQLFKPSISSQLCVLTDYSTSSIQSWLSDVGFNVTGALMGSVWGV